MKNKKKSSIRLEFKARDYAVVAAVAKAAGLSTQEFAKLAIVNKTNELVRLSQEYAAKASEEAAKTSEGAVNED